MQSSRITPFVMRTIAGSSRRTVSSLMRNAHQARNLHVQVPTAMYIRSDRMSQYPLSTGISRSQVRYYADKVIKVPQMAESISEGTLKQWVKQVGDFVHQDEEVATIETDKVDVTVNSPASGTIVEVYAQEEDTVAVGADFFKLELGDAPKEGASKPAPSPKKEEAPAAAAEPVAAPSKPVSSAPAPAAPAPAPAVAAVAAAATAAAAAAPKAEEKVKTLGSREEHRVKMNRMRLRIGERLKQSQDTAASLTTFNEIDMTNLIQLRNEYKDAVVKKHGVKLGFMSAFVKACSVALQEFPSVNGSIEGNEIVYHDYIDLSVAVSTPKGLVTPVLRNVEDMSFIKVEKTIAELGQKARENKITIEDLAGGTFTISNGGVFGSLMGTPILNLPQTAILGMHAIKERPIAVNGQVEIRPMMYVALTYDHRLIDGREAVSFLVRVKEMVEDPKRFLLEL